MYAGGETENILGRVLSGRDAEVTITATKANPFAGESLSPEGLRKQLQVGHTLHSPHSPRMPGRCSSHTRPPGCRRAWTR